MSTGRLLHIFTFQDILAINNMNEPSFDKVQVYSEFLVTTALKN